MFPFSQLHQTLAKPTKKHTRKPSVPPEKDTLGYHIRERRLALQLNQIQAAKYMSVPLSNFWRWELNDSVPTEGNMEKIIEFLGYTPIQQ